MLFELNGKDNYDVDLDYFNLNNNDKVYNFIEDYKNSNFNNYKNDKNKIDLENGYYLGNIFIDTYKPYKNYKPKKINAYSEQQKMLLRIYELDFILNDLNLYLDINPNDDNMFNKFKKTAIELNNLKDKYNEKYQVLELCKDVNSKYTWLDNPWPWDMDTNINNKRVDDLNSFMNGGYYV